MFSFAQGIHGASFQRRIPELVPQPPFSAFARLNYVIQD
jgi:hypothetical protein